MRLLFIILLFVSSKSNATRYFVSNSGNDANSGTSQVDSWQTISKVNSFSFSSGDTISFKCGDSWNERLNPPISNLYFNSYSTDRIHSIR
jgi:hypothetical protein